MRIVVISIILLLNFAGPAHAQAPEPVRIGFIGSLSGFAASYGSAVLDGAKLAVEELKREQIAVTLFIEDDASNTNNVVTAYHKLRDVNHVQGIIGGTWWARPLGPVSQSDGVPILSCETVYDEDTPQNTTFFTMGGDLRNWIRAFEPLIQEKKWKRGAIIRFASGFGATLADQMKKTFSRDGRTFVGAIEYNNLDASDGSMSVIQLRRLNPEVVFIDAQPGGYAVLHRKIKQLGISGLTLLTHSIVRDVLHNKLLAPWQLEGVYFVERASYGSDFTTRFQNYYNRPPQLNADLGYYSVHLLAQAAKRGAVLTQILRGGTVHDTKLEFDARNVYTGAGQRIFVVHNGKIVPARDER